MHGGGGEGGGGGGGGGAVTICVQAVTTKGHPNFDIIKKTREEKNSFQVISSVTRT